MENLIPGETQTISNNTTNKTMYVDPLTGQPRVWEYETTQIYPGNNEFLPITGTNTPYTRMIITLTENPKSVMKIGDDIEIYLSKEFEEEQIKHIEEYFGFEIKKYPEGE